MPRAVGGFEALGDLPEDLDGLVDRQRAASDALGEVFALCELHRQEVHVAIALEAVESGDVGVAQRGERPRLLLEARDPLGVLAQLFRQHLDRHQAAELGVARPIHLTHAAGAERGGDLVVAETGAGLEGHGDRSLSSSRVQPWT